VAIANTLQLEAARRCTVPIHFNLVACASFNLLSLYVAVLVCFYTLCYTVDLELWPCDLDLWHWTFVVCQLCHGQTPYQIWAKSDNPRRYCCSVIFDLITLNMYHTLRYDHCSGIVCAKFELRQAIRSWNVTIFFVANTTWHAMTLTFDPLTLKVCGRSDVTWL